MCILISCDCIPFAQRFSPLPVVEPHQVEQVLYPIMKGEMAIHPLFNIKEDAMLCHAVFLAICQNFDLVPQVDLFASRYHHQLPRYYTTNTGNPDDERYNAFNYNWGPEQITFANSQ